jgi:hypothetical protein
VRGRSQKISEPGRKNVVTEILLFHHAQGQTRGFLAFDDESAATLLKRRILAFLKD